ncbi:MAG: putative toxin-antitoxin system toxin component, PIN family [Arcicella sp.]|jgi:putative PIN family toxin of toxin-antitoxin system|nr:putative toxin-antitoxin system toxin component, PIN family [Arcicella sp.]
MKLVIDTNILVASLSSKSKYHWIIQALRKGQFELCITSEIYLEYEEVLKQKYNSIVADAFLNSLKELSNVLQIDVFYNWNLIEADTDDNKFADCAIAGNVDFLVTNDKHYNILNAIEFPQVRVISLEKFSKLNNDENLFGVS